MPSILKKIIKISGSIAVLLPLLAGASQGQSASELLEEAIYTEETAGDAATAANLYEKIADNTEYSDMHRAEALYRLTMTQLVQGDEAQARRVLARLESDFPNAKVWIEKAGEGLGTETFTPWKDGERLEYAVELTNGMEIGTMILAARMVEWQSEDAWLIEMRRFFGDSQRGLSRVYASPTDFRPLESQTRFSMTGQRVATFGEDGIELVSPNQDGSLDTDQLTPSGPVIDNDQLLHFLRRLPLEQGYKTSFELLAFTQFLDVSAEVKDLEIVKVPAGKFEAFRIQAMQDHKIWISNDEHRYPVKLKFGGAVLKLRDIGQVDDSGLPVDYSGNALNFTLTTPPSWQIYTYNVPSPGVEALELLDPDEVLIAKAQIQKRRAGDPKTARAIAERDIETIKTMLQSYDVREDSWREHTVHGVPAVSFVADFVDLTGSTYVDLRTYLTPEKRIAFFTFNVEPDLVEGHREALSSIVESMKFR